MDASIVPLPLPDEEEPARLAEVRKLPPRPRARRRLAIAAAIAVAVALLLLGADRLTSSPALCAACHEMAPRAAAWKTSPHVRVACVSCHVSPHPWYALPQALYDRGRLLGRDVAKHFAGGFTVPVDSRPPGVAPMPDAVCLQCHDPNRKPTAGLGILIDHPKHAKRNGSCVSCHVTVAHPSPSRGTALSFMGQCFTCHGSGKGAKAPATCTLCHPSDFQLLPASHKTSQWKRGHGKVALTDPRQCGMCHAKTFCDGCHGLPMPHPKGWAHASGHPAYAKRDRQVCVQCHGGQPDMCAMCHHQAYDPSKGTWVKQHFLEVEKRGAASCLEECHSPVFCADCHVNARPPSQ